MDEVVLVVRCTKEVAAALTAWYSTVQCTSGSVRKHGDVYLFHWVGAAWVERVGTGACEISKIVDDLSPTDYLLLHTWGEEAVDISGCFWDNPFGVKTATCIQIAKNGVETPEPPTLPLALFPKERLLDSARKLFQYFTECRSQDETEVVAMGNDLLDAFFDGYSEDYEKRYVCGYLYEELLSSVLIPRSIVEAFWANGDEPEEVDSDEEVNSDKE